MVIDAMWQPATGPSPELADILARLAKMHAQLREINKNLEWLNARSWELWKLEEGDEPNVPGV